MKVLLRLMLLLGVLTGLSGQSVAIAMVPLTAAPAAAMADMVGCAEMADGSMQDHGDMPCKHISLQCLAAMGCAPAAIALPAVTERAAPVAIRLAHARPVVTAMLGRSVAPELDPPSLLI